MLCLHMCFQSFQSAFPTGSAVILKTKMNQRRSHDINAFLIYYRRRDTNQQKSMCDLSVTPYIFLEIFMTLSRHVARNFDRGANHSQVSTFDYLMPLVFEASSMKVHFSRAFFKNNMFRFKPANT